MDSEGINKSLNTLSINEPSPSSQNIVSIDDVTLRDANFKALRSKPQKIKKNVQSCRPPPCNVAEKIIFCLDSVAENSTSFKNNENTYSSFNMFKRVIEIFVSNKNLMDPRHEFGVLSFDKQNVRWIQELSSFPRDIFKALDNVSSVSENDYPDSECDLSIILEEVWKTIKIPAADKPPAYVIRLILLYSRNSLSILTKEYKELLTNPYFVIDVILSHEEKLEDNKQQDIFDSLCIDNKECSYNFAVGTNASMLHESMAKLLSHPLQRSLQTQTIYKIPLFE